MTRNKKDRLTDQQVEDEILAMWTKSDESETPEERRKALHPKIREILDAHIAGTLKIQGGHRTNFSYYIEHQDQYDNFARQLMMETHFWQMLEDRGIPQGPVAVRSLYCFRCGGRHNYEFIEGEFVTDTPCKTSDEIEVDVTFPTGKIILNDWPLYGEEILVDHLKLDQDEKGYPHDINSTQGRLDRIRSYAKAGVLHVFVGNSCPSLFQKEDEYIIGHTIYPNETDEDEGDECPPAEGFYQIGHICTDLWWFTAVDLSDYEKWIRELYAADEDESKIQKRLKEVLDRSDGCIQIKPGTYRISVKRLEEEMSIYATFKLLEESP